MAKIHYTFRMDEDTAKLIFFISELEGTKISANINKYLREGLKNSKYGVIMGVEIPETEENENDQDNDRRGP